MLAFKILNAVKIFTSNYDLISGEIVVQKDKRTYVNKLSIAKIFPTKLVINQSCWAGVGGSPNWLTRFCYHLWKKIRWQGRLEFCIPESARCSF